MKCQYLGLQKKNFATQLTTSSIYTTTRKRTYKAASRSFRLLPSSQSSASTSIAIAVYPHDTRCSRNWRKVSHFIRIVMGILLVISRELLGRGSAKMRTSIGPMTSRSTVELSASTGRSSTTRWVKMLKLNTQLTSMQASLVVDLAAGTIISI